MDIIVARARALIERDLIALSIESGRLPRHYVDHKAFIHGRIDALLTEWQASDVDLETSNGLA